MTQIRSLATSFLIATLLICGMPASVFAQLGSPAYTFSAGTVIRSSEVNSLFSTIYSNALNRTGGTMTGTLTTLGLVPTTTNASDIGTSSVLYRTGYFGTSLVLGAATTSGILLDLNAGALEVREGDDSGYGPLAAGAVTVTTLNTYTFNQSVASGAAPTFTGTNFTGIPISTAISGLGTGVGTALAVNVGTAGAFVVNGGALGTPSSGTLTNATGLPIATGVSGLGTGVATWLATPSSANLISAVTDETGSGALVFATSPTLVTPALGTPSSVTLTNATGLPVATGISGLGTGIATALAVNVGSAGAPVLFNGAGGTPSSLTLTNATGLPETAITDGSILARLAANETVTGSYRFNAAIANTGANSIVLAHNGTDAQFWGLGSNGSTNGSLVFVTARSDASNAIIGLAISSTGAASAPVSLSIGGGSAISSSSNVALLNAVNAFTNTSGTLASFTRTGSTGAFIGVADSSGSSVFFGGTSGVFSVQTPGGSYSDKFTISSGGDVGIPVGLLTVSGFGSHSFSAGGTGANELKVANTTSGTGNYASLTAVAGTTTTGVLAFSQGYSTGTWDVAGAVALYSNGSTSIYSAAGDTRLYSSGALALTLGASQAATFTGSIISSVSVALTGTTNNVGTITTGVWNAGAVTSSGTITGVAGTFSGVLSTTSSLAIASGSNFYFDGVAASGDTYMEESSANVLDTYAGGVLTTRVEASSFKVLGAEATAATLYLWADEGDDADDKWSLVTSLGTAQVGFYSNATLVAAVAYGSSVPQFTVYGGTADVLLNGNTAGGPPNVSLGSGDFGTNAGPDLQLGYNNNVTTPAAGYVNFRNRSGVAGNVWQDSTGDLRIGAATPTNANDTSGTVIGDQTSLRSAKTIYGAFTDNAHALRTMLDTPLWTWSYANGRYHGEKFMGITLGDGPENANIFGKDNGKAFNELTFAGYTIAAIKELNHKIELLEAEVSRLRNR